ncbi:hypothetical protein Pst134EA_013078 [Puccinia striiformis f. sp. tritici]|uniref:hypothetical protein n=1 Tax=Puccinia striiformis f. sp. tritici TaxID=168172 RepID=UPI002008AA4C|nr:hypothetical protein Pst134EA_013078 [Puccinia striiformis f. sp. tritici]KAH9465185.1 hypothetical protein Pst134EA_013078 [Puccinia striiformis f. sp. tritici]
MAENNSGGNEITDTVEQTEQKDKSNELIHLYQTNISTDSSTHLLKSEVDCRVHCKEPEPSNFQRKDKTDSRFSFLDPDDAYNPYYRHRIETIKNGGDLSQPASTSKTNPNTSAAGGSKTEEGAGRLPEPITLEFLIEPSQMPKINAVNLKIIKLTALFTAQLGPKFVTDHRLGQQESRNYQFDFLRPCHFLFAFFNQLIKQYTSILIPQPKMMSQLEKLAGGPPINRKRLGLETIN